MNLLSYLDPRRWRPAPGTPAGLVASYRRWNLGQPAGAELRQVFEAACSIGHQRWPLQIADLLPGRDVLDVGCGCTFYGAVMRALGARSYVGTDPRMDLHRRTYRSRLVKGSVRLDLTPADLVRIVPNLSYHDRLDPPAIERFDLALMHTVTEHLLDIDAVFRETALSLRPGGALWFLHDNFAAWAGHHQRPHSPRIYDPTDPKQAQYADWAHLSYQPDPSHFFSQHLNRIRLAELRAATERHFDIVSWETVPEGPEVACRLTPAIEASLPGYDRAELLTRHVICLAVRR